MQKSPSQPTAGRQRLDTRVFALASLVAAIVLVSIVAIPQYFSKAARFDGLRAQVGEIGRLAASVVDGDLHRKLLHPANYSDDLYARALAPLVKFHSADPDIVYVYTMVERDGVAHFVLDTANSSDLRTKHTLEASAYMEAFEAKPGSDGEWLKDLAAGQDYVSENFEEDDYGTFLTAHVPIYDSQGRNSGFVGVDFDTGYYLARESVFRTIAVSTIAVALLLALAIGYFAARYHASMRGRIKELHEASIRDSLTGFYNRRGVMEVIKKGLESSTGKTAMLLASIDNLKTVNDRRGHATGDAVVARTSEAIRRSVRDMDQCGRLGDQFLIYLPDCDAAGAAEIGERILGNLTQEGMYMARAPFSVSIGIATCEGGAADFARMYREADDALRLARAESRGHIGIAPLSEDCQSLASEGDAA